MINKLIYLNYLYSYCFYNEVSFFYMMAKSSHRKIRHSSKFTNLFNNNEIIKKINLFSFNIKKHHYLFFKNSLIESEQNFFFKEALYNSKSKIKIVGRGWKIVKYSYQLLIKLGYSHSFFLLLHPFLKYKMKKKKKKYYIFYGVSYNQLNKLMARLSLMRIPDVYTRKGIFHRKVRL